MGARRFCQDQGHTDWSTAVPQLQDLPLHVAQGLQEPLIVLLALAELRLQSSDCVLFHQQQLPDVTGFLLLFAECFLEISRYTFFLLNFVCQ